LAYVSFEKGNSAIYTQDVATGARELISSGPGINGAPSFSPDGTKMALTLSRTGNPEIFVRDMATGRLDQLTQHWSIDTEPVWSPDGRNLYFTSDRGGKPQIYRVPAGGGEPTRVTLEGDYNARASIAPDGRTIAMAHGRGNEYRIAVWDIETERFTILTPGKLDESPSFAPNGSMILYATREGERGVLSAVSADGNVRQRLILSEGDVREPAWSPVIR
jgi:TolB protein